MAVHVSIGTAIDKSKLASGVTYIALLEIDVIDPDSGDTLETVRLAHNNEDYVFQGNTYVQMPFDFNVQWAKNELPQITLTVVDVTQVIHGKLEEYRGATDFPVRLLIVSSANPGQAEIEENFTIVASEADANDYSVKFTLGAENPLTMRWPIRLMFRHRCPWKYRSAECGYSGGLASCDFSYDGPNGCKAHNNTVNFGGFPGIRRYSYR